MGMMQIDVVSVKTTTDSSLAKALKSVHLKH
jgi:hypothetical protein